MRKYWAPVVASFFLASCAGKVVDVYVADSYTNLGHINSQNLNLGRMFLWDTRTNTLTHIEVLEPAHVDRLNGGSLKLKASSGVEIDASAKLSPAQKASLKAEAARRTSIEAINTETVTISRTITLLSDTLNADPRRAEDWQLNRAISSHGQLLYVLIYENTKATQLNVNVDNTNAVGATFESGVNSPDGKVSFKIFDAGSIEKSAVGESRISAFLRFHVLEPHLDQGNYNFAVVTTRYRDKVQKAIKETL